MIAPDSGCHLHFVQSIEPLYGGGLASAALSLCRAMQDRGATSRLIATRERNSEGPPDDKLLQTFVRNGPRPFYFSSELLTRASEIVRSADFVHAHGLYTFQNALFGSYARRLGVPLVIHAHGFFDPWILARSRAKKRLAGIIFENRNFAHAHLWRALTLKEAEQIRLAVPSAKDKIIVVPNGVDLASVDIALSRTSKKVKLDKKTILLMSRLHPKKGVQLFLRSWSVLASKFPDWQVMIAGPDEGNFQSRLEEQVHELSLDTRVSFLGPLIGDKKFAYLAAADIFVLPSFSEGFPMTLVEASACGTPSVFTSECNFPELALAKGGWQCDPYESSLSNALQLAIQCGDLERRMRGREAYKLIESSFTVQGCANSFIGALER